MSIIAYPIATLIYVGLIALGWFGIQRISAPNLVPLFVAWIAAMTGLMAAVVAAIANRITAIKAARTTAIANEEVEKKRREHAQHDALSAEKRAEIRRALDGIGEAVNLWYAAIAKLEGGVLDSKAIREAEKAMDKARGLADKLESPCLQAFYIFYNTGNFIKEHAEEHCNTPEQREAVWAKHMRQFNEEREEFGQKCWQSYPWR